MVSADGTMSLWEYAQEYLGNGMYWHQLVPIMPSNGIGPNENFEESDPNMLVPGGINIYLPNESPGPPATPALPIPGYNGNENDWQGLDRNAINDILALADQFDALSNHRIVPNHGDLVNMAREGVTSAFQMGQYMLQQGQWGQSAKYMQLMPWIAFGMSQTDFQNATQNYQDMVESMTGRTASQADVARALMSTRGQLDPAHWKTQFMQDDNNRKQFGWIKYGLDYQQFQAFRDTQARKFGHTLDDQQGAAWLDETKMQEANPVEGAKEIVAQPVAAPNIKSGAAEIGQAAIR